MDPVVEYFFFFFSGAPSHGPGSAMVVVEYYDFLEFSLCQIIQGFFKVTCGILTKILLRTRTHEHKKS